MSKNPDSTRELDFQPPIQHNSKTIVFALVNISLFLPGESSLKSPMIHRLLILAGISFLTIFGEVGILINLMDADPKGNQSQNQYHAGIGQRNTEDVPSDQPNPNSRSSKAADNLAQVHQSVLLMEGTAKLETLTNGSIRIGFSNPGIYAVCINTSGAKEFKGNVQCEKGSIEATVVKGDTDKTFTIEKLPDSAFALIVRDKGSCQQCVTQVKGQAQQAS